MRYPGGKGRSYQSVINLMPPHDTYIESHVGGGAVMRFKRPARRNLGCDADPIAIERLSPVAPPGTELVVDDATNFLSAFEYVGGELVYSDPPFWPAARRRERCYRHDYGRCDHERLVDVLLGLPCLVMLSGYRNPVYEERLSDWHRTDLVLPTHVGMVAESIWTNFLPGELLHDYSYVGDDFREREALKRRRSTNVKRLAAAHSLERNATLADLADAFPEQFLAAAERLA